MSGLLCKIIIISIMYEKDTALVLGTGIIDVFALWAVDFYGA